MVTKTFELSKVNISKIVLANREVDVLRLDLVHPLYGGNKFYKLKLNIEKAKVLGYHTILTFGGAHSNHIFSTSAYCKENGISSVAVIRGREEEWKDSPTLRSARQNEMQLHFVGNESYRRKGDPQFINELQEIYGHFYLIPEGGNNKEGVRGCSEIMNEELKVYDFVFCACGTATTFSGLLISAAPHQKVIGISVLKGENTLIDSANNWMNLFDKERIRQDDSLNTSTILNSYHMGGYAAFSQDLLDFKVSFEKKFSIPLDYVYTTKLFYAVNDLLQKMDVLRNKKILVIHSGGQQGNSAFERRYGLG